MIARECMLDLARKEVGCAEQSGKQGGEVDGPDDSEHGERRVTNGLSCCCTIEDYMERMSHQIVANDQNGNKDNGSRGAHGKNGQVPSTPHQNFYPAIIQLCGKVGSE